MYEQQQQRWPSAPGGPQFAPPQPPGPGGFPQQQSQQQQNGPNYHQQVGGPSPGGMIGQQAPPPPPQQFQPPGGPPPPSQNQFPPPQQQFQQMHIQAPTTTTTGGPPGGGHHPPAPPKMSAPASAFGQQGHTQSPHGMPGMPPQPPGPPGGFQQQQQNGLSGHHQAGPPQGMTGQAPQQFPPPGPPGPPQSQNQFQPPQQQFQQMHGQVPTTTGPPAIGQPPLGPPGVQQNGPSYHQQAGPSPGGMIGQPPPPPGPPQQFPTTTGPPGHPPGPPKMSAPTSAFGQGHTQPPHGMPGMPGMPPQPPGPPGPPGPGGFQQQQQNGPSYHQAGAPPGMPPGMPGMPPPMGGAAPHGQFQQHQGFGQPQAPGMPPPMTGYPPTQPGMPPAGPPMGGPGFPGGAGGPGFPGHGMPPGGPAQPAKRLDASMMPSAIQVMDDDRRTRSGLFQTGYPRAELPPLATTEFLSEDQGNSNPKFIRASTYAVPLSADMIKQCSVPISLSLTPMAELDPQEHQPPIVNLGQLGPVRCTRCKAYMCPFMEFNDGGRRFRCPFCRASSEVPAEYFAHLDHAGRRVDAYERPELCLGSYEFVGTTEYCKNGLLPKPPAFIFMIDVSYNSVRNGIVKLICDNIKGLLNNLPRDMGAERSEIRVGFATYDQAVHFYNLKSAVGQPGMLIVNDVQDMFVPLVDGFLVAPWEAEAAIDCLLQQIPNNFADTKVTEIILGPVIQAGLDALKASDRSGKIFVFHSSLPLYEAPGKLKNREDRKLLGTDKEKTILTPASEFYNKLGPECVAAGCSVDMFLFPNSYADVATIGCLCGTTGGQLYKYPYFQPDVDGPRFLADLKHDLERPIVFDSIMRVRTSTGIRPTDFFGNFYMSNTTDVELATLDSDKTITVEIKHDDKLDEDGVYIQAALLFTSPGGQRRLRIHNLSLQVAQDLASLYRSADLFATINYMAKSGERAILQKSPREVRESLTKTSAHILSAYRQHCSPSSSMGQLVLPEGMKLLPLLINCIIKHDAFVGGSELTVDDKAWLMQAVPSMRVVDTVYYFYPRLLSLMETDGLDEELLPTPVRCSFENLSNNAAYLLENGFLLFLWIGSGVSPDWVQDVFGVQNFGQINGDKNDIPEKDNPTSRRLRKMIAKLQSERPRSMKLYIIKQQEKLEPWFKRYLVEDRSSAGADSTPSYVDFLVHIHNEIREMLSH